MQYRKKPVIVDAFRFEGTKKPKVSINMFPDWALQAVYNGELFFEQGEMFIKTLEGDMHASPGDFIIKGVKGELYSCKPDIFEKTYEKV